MPISINDDLIYQQVRTFILAVLADQNPLPEVVRDPGNGVPIPAAPFIAMSPSLNSKLSFPVSTYTDVPGNGTRNLTQHLQYAMQIDCYGPQSPQWSAILTTLFFSEYAVTQMGPNVTPLYCEEAQQLPLVNAEAQFEQRWSFPLLLQYNPVVSVPQDFAASLTVNLKEVDTEYKA